ncbi:MAG: phosphotransferase family protein [Acidimicrobiales bacterium]
MATDELERALHRLLVDAGAVGPGARLADLRRLSGGASRETWSFDAVDGEQRHALILQRLRPGASGSTTATPLGTEAALVQAAGAHGVAVPTVHAIDVDGSTLGSPGMVVERLEGETIARKLLRDDEWATARSRLGAQAAHALAAIHAMPVDAVDGLRPTDQLEQLRALLDGLGEPHPAFELGLRWLDAHRPATTDTAIVHGDFRLGNLLVGPDGLRAVLDWELAHLGDPLEDLGWLCVRAWRFGSPLPAGGVATRDELAAAYEAAGGRPVDPEALRWWELLGTLKWGVICIMQAWGHLSGAARSVELATIGRRVCENEWDVLQLLPGGPLVPEVDTDPAPPAALHGRPTATELVEAVREWVDSDVREGTEGRLSFHARVAVNALRMVERELAMGPEPEAAHQARLSQLGCADDADLAAKIRAGELDDRAEQVRAVVAQSVAVKVAVANPAWLTDG